ncbi:Chitin synthase regulatory factor 4 [Spathaspora sp. JA1]|nr:Chitin synthase regulatory factor 4 [Spathaspora sp. JA1]
MGLFSRLRGNRSADSSVKSKDHMRTDSFNGSVFSSATSDSSSTSTESMAYNNTNKHSQPRTNRSLDPNALTKGNATSAASSAWKSRPKSQFVERDAASKVRINRPMSQIHPNGLPLVPGETNTNNLHNNSPSPSHSPNRQRGSSALSRKPPAEEVQPLATTPMSPPQTHSKLGKDRSLSPTRGLVFSTPQKQVRGSEEFSSHMVAASHIPTRSSPLAKVYSPSPVIAKAEVDNQFEQPPVVSQKEGSISPMSPAQPLAGTNDSQLSLMLSPVSESVTSMNDPLPTSQFHFNQPPHPSYVYQKSLHTKDQEIDSDEEERRSSTSTVPPSQHPYYEQWKQYYEQLALQQQQYMNSNPSLYGNGAAAPPPGPPPPPHSQDGNFNPMMLMNPMHMPPYFYNPFMPMQVPPSPTATNASMPQLSMNYSNSQLFDPYMLQQMQQQQQQPPQKPQSFTQPTTPVKSGSVGNLVLKQASVDESEDNNTAEPSNDYLNQYKKTRNMKNELISDDNELVSNSRKSTVKSNRYPSAPFQVGVTKNVNEPRGRVASVDTNFRPNEFHIYEEDEDDSKNVTETSIPSSGENLGSSSNTLQMSLEDRRKSLSRHISDYNKYLFGTEQEEEDDSELEITKKDVEGGNNLAGVDHQLPTPTSELSRNESESSTNSSCDSIESNGSGKFIVGELKTKKSAGTSVIPPRESSISPEPKNKTKKKIVPPPQSYPFNTTFSRSGGDLNGGAVAPSPRPLSMMPQLSRSMEPMFVSPYASNPVLSQNTEYNGSSISLGHNRRQSIATTESKRRSMAIAGGAGVGGVSGLYRDPMGAGNKRNSVAVFGNFNQPQQQHQIPQSQQGPGKITDVTISKKIDEFIKLRKKIASGQKSLEYRLYWVKMLIDATNFKLYAYINIKGDYIQPEQIQNNKILFIKSSETHLTKLMKELDNDIIQQEGIKSEVYFIYGSLLKQDYLSSYNQDFGFEKDVMGSIEYFEKVLEINPKDFRVLYKLGEIYEFDFPEEFERAVQYYTEAAKLGYNRAIFKMSMLYLHIPELRSVKYLKYLHNLANIELRDVKLDEEDFDEMEEIIGLASYELGRIYEGVYPGDLSMEDDFIKESVELAPVNYAKSLTYYNKSARLNCLLAQVRLGIVYEKGELNRQQNPNKSIQWFIKASSSPLSFRRHPEAMVGLARWYLRGTEGSSKYVPIACPEKAVLWCDRAIKEFNSPDAMYFMGELSEMRFTNSNPQGWYQKAYELGYEPAAQKLGYV